MKTSFIVFSFLFSLGVYSTPGQGSAPQDTDYSVVEKDANSRVWERTTYEQMPSGDFFPRVHRVEELATGLNFKNTETGEWEESAETIEQIEGGATARQGQHKVIFAADIATFGAIDLEMPDGSRLQSHLLGLSYFDRSSGQSVFIAEVTNSVGQLVSSNQVWYDNAFNGIKAGVRYTYTRDGFEQDVILEEQPLAPEAYGLNSATTVLQAFTEFISPPVPQVSMSSPGEGQLSDTTLCFKTMKIGRGRAFLMGSNAGGCAVCKEWTSLEGRQFLIEEVPIPQIAQELQTLPAPEQAMTRFSNSVMNVVSLRRLLPPQPLAKVDKRPMRIAGALPVKSGLVLDYASVNTSQTNFTFRGDTTYYLSGSVSLYGTNSIFEGGTVIKYASGVSLTVNTPVDWRGSAYRPVVMLAKDDNTIGESISGSSGAPGGNFYATKALYFDGTSALTNLTIQNLRVLNANAAVVINGQSNHVISDLQIVKCADGIAATNTDFSLRNGLFALVRTNFTGSSSTGRVEQLTSDVAIWLNKDIGTNLFLTNCLLSAITNLGSCATQSVAMVSSNAGVFQMMGAGYYLTNNSPYRNVGTTNINPTLLIQLGHKTTYAPVLCQNSNFNALTTLGPVIQRDTDTPDLGYHYDPLDYVMSGVNVNTNLTISAGTSVGWFKPNNGNAYAIHLADKVKIMFNGTFEAQDYFVQANTVQETNGTWAGISGFGIIGSQNQSDVTLSSEIDMSFTTMSVLIWDQQFRDNNGYLIARANNSVLVGGNSGGYLLSSYFTNCMVENQQIGTVYGYPGNEVYLRNCTLYHGVFYGQRVGAIPISVRDCAFDAVNMSTNSTYMTNTNYSDFDYNAYTNSANLFPIGCAHDQKSVTFNWKKGPLGYFYLPSGSALIDTGHTNANLLGLYHFTTQTNQTKETNSVVDIGYHYLAVDGNKNPMDSDGDGIADFREDANGNGIYDGGDSTDWSSSDTDGDGLSDGYEVAHGSDPLQFASLQLGLWRFDNTVTWQGDSGQFPLLALNVRGITSWDTNAALLDTNSAVLSYREVESVGTANITVKNGSVRFWFRPDWSSTNVGGSGPRADGRFIEFGSKGSTDGWWSLAVDTFGTNLYFGTQTNSTATLTTNVSTKISWVSNVWHQAVLTYSATNSSLYIDGQPVATNGAGVSVYPGASVRSNGFTIGGSASGTNQARGAFENLETFNYPLSASDISSNYDAVTRQDRDGNGLFDVWEINHFGQLGVDPSADPDGDGLSNAGEEAAGTDPLVSDNARLGYWRFNDSPNWLDESGLAPMVAQGLVPIPSWSVTAVKIDARFQAVLSYPGVRTNGSEVVHPSSGTVRFWFKPTWSGSPDQNGSGPGDTVRLFEVGQKSDDATHGWFALTVNSLGNRLDLISEAGGIHTVNASAYSAFASNQWYQITMTYGSNDCAIYVNGQNFTTNGVGFTNVPIASRWQQGFNLGGTLDGIHQAGGSFEELETFNYPLPATNIFADYSAQMAVLATNGLPTTVADGLGLRLDAMDTDCDGLPDAWELANGLNPKDPTDATPTLLSLYTSGGSVAGPLYSLGALKSNIWNLAFVTDAGASAGLTMRGAAIHGTNSGLSTNDAWNFADIHSDYINGIPLRNANSNATTVNFYSYIGPCQNAFILPPGTPYGLTTFFTYQETVTHNEDSTLITNVYTIGPGFVRYLTNKFSFLNTVNFNTVKVCDWYQDVDTDVARNGSTLITDPDSPYNDYYYSVSWETNVFDQLVYTYQYSKRFPRSDFYSTWYYPTISLYNCATTGLFALPYRYNFYMDTNCLATGLFYTLNMDVQEELTSAFNDSTSSAQALEWYLNAIGISLGEGPMKCVYCYIPPFKSVAHSSTTLAGNDGAMWRFVGNTNQMSTNVAGGWFKTFFPDATRTMLIGGLSSGNYQVLVYFDCVGNAPAATINNTVPTMMSAASGTKFWSALVKPSTFATITNVDQALTALAPASVLTNEEGKGCIQINIAPTNVFSADMDVKILGIQLIREGDLADLEGRPGNGAVYLDWGLSGAAMGFNVYRSIGNTNSWILVKNTSDATYADTNVTAGTTYYYKVTSTNGAGSLITSSVAGFVPFGCLAPLPPRIDFVTPLALPENNGSYEINWQCLLTNSDAFDPQGYPLTFKIDSVVSGSLMIDGSPFGPANRTIYTNSLAVWTPSATTLLTNKPSFRAYVDDGVNRSTNTVDVFIKQHPAVHVMGWGFNWAGQAGVGKVQVSPGAITGVTNFVLGSNSPNPELYGGAASDYEVQLEGQDALGVLPRDPRWTIVSDGSNQCVPPTRVLDLDKVSSIAPWSEGGFPDMSCAVTPDKQLWVWGTQLAYFFGRPLVVYSNEVHDWDYDVAPHEYRAVASYFMVAPSPIPFRSTPSNSVMSGVVSAKDGFIIKEDGSLWSMGDVTYWGGKIGRNPQFPKDLVAWYDGRTAGILPGRVEIDGNTASGIVPGREVIDVCEGGFSGLARCKDGSLWWWGTLDDSGGASCGGETDAYRTYLAGGDVEPYWLPKRLTSMEISGAAPVKQMCASINHYVFLREDGSVQELGYIPGNDPDRPLYFGWGCGLTLSGCYSLTPVTVAGLPRNICQISAGWNFTAALTDDGDVWVWGHWADQTVPTPQRIGTLSDITKVAAGDQFLIALDRFGHVWAVGRNMTGVFGYIDLDPSGNYDVWYRNGKGAFHTNAVEVAGVENATDIFLSGSFNYNWTAFAIGTEVQGKPVGLVASGRDRAVSLSWNQYPGAASYLIYRSLNRNEGYTIIGSTTNVAYLDSNPPLQNGQGYYYEVSAVVNGVETAPSWQVSAVPYPVPGPVVNLTGVWSCHGVKLQWQAPTNVSSSPLDEYQIFANGVQLTDLPTSSTFYFDNSVISGSNYTYTVVAYNSSGAASNSVSPSGTNACDPAPHVATNSDLGWFFLASSDDLNDQATLEWTGPTNAQEWLFQPVEFDRNSGSGGAPINNLIENIFNDPSPISAWLWSQIMTNGTDTNALQNESGPVTTRVSILMAALNQILTNGQSVSNLSFFTAAIDSSPFRPPTASLFHTFPQGAGLVQLKRRILDDYFGAPCFVRGGNWGSDLDGFRIHYRTIQYINGFRSERTFQRDVALSNLGYNHGSGKNDEYNGPIGLYTYSWPIPKGSLCWASVSAIVDGQESDLSGEVGPSAVSPDQNLWNQQSEFRAIPGDHQVYLDWAPDTNAYSYTLYWSINSDDTNHVYPGEGDWQQVGVNLPINRFWHTNLVVGNTNYYMLVANDYFDGNPKVLSKTVSAIVTNTSPTTNWFSADAAAYNGMVLVEWRVPTNEYTTNISLSQTNWQFYVERKGASDGESGYKVITDVDYGLAYLDTDVDNGQSYNYRVTAFDLAFNRLQAMAVVRSGSGTNITPSLTNGLTLLPPQPGNGYVNLTWSPIRATQFVVKHSLNADGPFDVVGTLNVSDAYQNAQNTYQDGGLQNGVMYYYQIEATTPTGFKVESDIKGTMPLATLAPLPPKQFKGMVLPSDGTNTAFLSWQKATGAVKYQVFLQTSTLTPLLDTVGTSGAYTIPVDTGSSAILTFAVRAVNSGGVASELTFTTVTNQPFPTTPAVDNPVVLKVGGVVAEALTNMGPTNLVLSADVNLPDVSQVSFYSDGQLIGTVEEPPFQLVWYHVPGGDHVPVTAVALVGQDAFNLLGASSTTFASAPCFLTVVVQPQLSAYQTSATDLQLPAPALPLSLSRSYSSRNTTTNGLLGVGWAAAWNLGAVTLSTNLEMGWKAVSQLDGLKVPQCYIGDAAGHYVTVTLPQGESIYFSPQLDYDHGVTGGADDEVYANAEIDSDVGLSFTPYEVNSGTFSTSLHELSMSSPTEDSDPPWVGQSVVFDTAALSDVSYTAPDGTIYQFDHAASDGLTWLLTRTIDRNGNSLNYSYTNDTLLSISNSCGRSVRFSYSNSGSTTNISVYDMIGSNPAVVYVVSNHFLTEVRQLVDRSGSGTYQTNRYVYGTDSSGAPANFNRITDVYDARGIKVLQNTYTNDNGDLRIQISPGRTNTFAFNTDDYSLTVTAASATGTNTALVSSDPSGAISGATQPLSGTNADDSLATQITYDTQGNVVSQTDANGNTKTYSYDDLNRLVGQSDENGNSTSTILNAYGQPTVATDANGKQTLYQYDANGNPTNVKDPSGTSTSYAYSGPLTTATAYLGAMQTRQSQLARSVPYTIVTLNTYSTNGSVLGNLIQSVEEWQDSGGKVAGLAVSTSYQYDDNGNRTVEIKQRTLGNSTQYITNIYTYDAMNRVIQTVVGADGAEVLTPQTNTVVYNALGKQAMTVDAAGRTNTSTYDINGNLIETKSADGTVTRTSYDGFGRQQYVQDRATPDGSDATTAAATLSLYDASGRVTNSVRLASITLTKTGAVQNTDFAAWGTISASKMVASSPGTAMSSNLTFYDAVGRVQYSVDGRGGVTENRYDAAGRRTNTLVYTDHAYSYNGTLPPAGSVQSTRYTYDANGNQIAVVDAAGHTNSFVYDDANRVIETDYPSDNGAASRRTYYDGLGRKIQETDEAGVATTYTYDFRGLLTSVTLAAGTAQAVMTSYDYDELGNMITQTDAAGRATTFRYDALGRRVTRTLPGGQKESMVYDLTGNVIYQTNFNSMVITNYYDVMNRLTSRLAGGNYQVSYAYNTNSGLRTNMTDATGVTWYQYDGLNRLTQKTVAWSNGPTVALNYSYDATGQLTNLYSSSAGGVTNGYQYDVLGRLTNVVAFGSNAATYSFDAVGNLQTTRFGSGVTNLYQYDARNRLTNLVWNLSSTALGSFRYTVGLTGNRTALSENLNGTSRTYAWTYDLLYRMTGETMSGLGAVSYQFDAVGNRTNRTSSVSGLNNQSFIYNPNDWLTNTDTYDSNGNTTASSGTAYQYDVMNHLTNSGSGTVLIGYDGDGNRAKKTAGSTTTYYLLDDRNPSGYVQVLEEWTISGTTTNLAFLYNYGLDLISQKRVNNSSIRYFGYDGHGSTRFLTDPSGTLSDTYVYDAYGTKIASTGISQNKYLYCGEQFDSDLNFYYLRARYYKPDSGRFWTMDSYEGGREDPSSLHKYLYAGDDPVNLRDPSGHESIGELLTVTFVIADIASQMQGSIAMAYKSARRGSFPDAFGMGVYGAAPVVESALNKIGLNAGGELAGIGGAYVVFQPKKQRASLYLWAGGEGSVSLGMPEHGGWKPEFGAFETWMWRYDDRHETDLRPLDVLGASVGGSLYAGGIGPDGIGADELLLGFSDNLSTGGFALFSTKAWKVVSSPMSENAMTAAVAFSHSLVSYAQGATLNAHVDQDPGSIAAAAVGNSLFGAYWVRHAWGTGTGH